VIIGAAAPESGAVADPAAADAGDGLGGGVLLDAHARHAISTTAARMTDSPVTVGSDRPELAAAAV
jgi:hypothetical protein